LSCARTGSDQSDNDRRPVKTKGVGFRIEWAFF
jgi:hypothetical protein